MSNTTPITPFAPAFAPADVHRLQAQLRDARLPESDIVPGAGIDYGMPTEWARKVTDHWTTKYSYDDALRRISAMGSHHLAQIEDLQIHFVHRKSKRSDAIPLIMFHGWPGSFYEFNEIIGPLSEGEKDGPAFNVVVPSLPGFCWSEGPKRRGWTMKDTARVFHKLMLDLGYEEYAVQAGDWGQFVARELGAQYSDSCRVVHLNYCPGTLPQDATPTDRETKCKAKGEDWRTNHVGYAVLMRTRPQTLGWMLLDSPIGLLGFVGEKYEEAASPSISSQAHWIDHVITTVVLYYFTRCLMTSCLPYYENVPHHKFADFAMQEENLIKSPFGYTSMWYDTAPNSKRAVERTGNLVFYNERDYAGHFACMEDPKGIAQDVREVVGKHWSPGDGSAVSTSTTA